MLKVIDLFAGAGGFGLGFQLAGYTVNCSVEIDKWAADTLRVNNPNMKVIDEDIRGFQSSKTIRQVCSDSPDVVIGGPPCQGFSIAGPAQKDPKDPRNSLFKDFARWVESLNPQVFVMENVRGILSRKNADGEKVIGLIQNIFANLGYGTEIWKLNAAEYGVPQLRERVFVVGNRIGTTEIGKPVKTHFWAAQNGSGLHLSSDILRPAVSVWEAISDLPELDAGEGDEEQRYIIEPETDFQRWARENQKLLFNHVAMKHTKRLVERFRLIEWGQSGLDVPKEHGARKRGGNGELSKVPYNSNNRRLHPERPSYTIPASFYSSFIHPFQHRNLTAREAARIQSFPDWYRFMGKRTVISRKLLERKGRRDENYLSQYNQIGNAVPPLLAKAIAEHIQCLIVTRERVVYSNKQSQPSEG
ncbi:DNA cytosine methyltransferase [Candidatus Poribacteria bacterium]|nr:DNA cytosine methyltransferase [Candidatus Poribacteria bacterium]